MRTTTRDRRRRRAAARGMALALPCAALALLAACGAPADSGEPEAAPSDSEQAFMDWQLAYAQCMRENGVDMADPVQGEGGVSQGFDLSGTDPEVVEQAGTACREELGEPPVSGMDRDPEAVREEQLELAECLREQGYDVADPVPGEAMGLPSDIGDDAASACGLEGGFAPAAPR
ncbi:hypothetical protein [Allonocardiopsis opalescens]|uniref:Secreted protein n=1 Tax=Allonocardiopsis opalescens TaxID=1144618 RepID=A0A2T0Q1X2_9ACTN|nr:hypothetical protein [Allonocardiopsis opalescens]PRX97793.1 hypothetical protein CLV72_105143 [Allonocardiopsis opalescens]